MARYHFPIPIGWFEVALTGDLQPGQIKQLRAFEQDLMLWRGMDGAYHLQETYCPHLGANIAADGRVVDNTVECPFHHWRFDGTGEVAAIPYAPDAKKSIACLRTYPVRDYYGVLMAWHHPKGIDPLYDLPVIAELHDPAIRGPLSQHHMVNSCVQEMAENTVDYAHFVSIHQHPGPAEFDSVRFDKHEMIVKTLQEYPSSKGPVKGTLGSYSYGMGCGVVRYKTLIEITMVALNTPIDRETTRQHFMVYYKNPTDDPKTDRIAQAFHKEVNRQFEQDIPIWNKKIYREKPVLTVGEGSITRFRQWAKQFYAEDAA
jgi:phenylpropionate dioxygenase-like ring-hydroxylating dioxygenase large terminal subunit